MIELKNLSVAFSSGAAVLDSMDLTVATGRKTVVIGESGSGKSVMLCAILHILPPNAIVSGSVKLNGLELLSLNEKELRRLRGSQLAYIPQGSSNSLNPLLTVGLQVAEPLTTLEKLPKKVALARAVDWLRGLRFGDEEALAEAYPHTLSGGMKQRVMIAMGTIAGAGVLLADEPTKGLDSEKIDAVISLLKRLDDKTLLCVSHDLRFAREIADDISVMYSAQQVETCSRDEFFSNPLHPYSRLMLEAMPENGLRAGEGYAPPTDEAPTGCRFYSRCPSAQKKCHSPPPLVRLGARKVRCHIYADSC